VGPTPTEDGRTPSNLSGIKSEERLIPTIRAALAERLSAAGFKVKEIAGALNVTPAAVTQYLNRKRGARVGAGVEMDELIGPLAEEVARRFRSGSGAIKTVELLETARQVMVISAGKRMVVARTIKDADRTGSLELLRKRLKLELSAAESYLELANRTGDDHTKLLLRMIASDSIRHADVVSQMISWLESGGARGTELPGEELLRSMLALEDSANEVNLGESVDVDHPVARLLLEWIDMDEAKHGKMVTRMLAMDEGREGAEGSAAA
jgi:predicted transcriptional regulator